MELTPEWVAAVTGGTRHGSDPAVRAGIGLAFDSRRVRPGEVFAALAGERDGHEFVPAAIAAGAPFAITARPVGDQPGVVVDDVAAALLALTRAARLRLHARVVGITGSVGKTSTKDLAAAALAAGARTHAAPESFNNEVGVPVTVLGAPEDVEALVVEMGARFAGNIAELCALIDPEVGIITNIGISHAEHLGGPEGVARTKGELLDALPAGGLAVVAADCEASAGQRSRSAAPVFTVGTGPGADIQVSAVALDDDLRPTLHFETPWGATTTRLEMRGLHQTVNAGQALAAAVHLGVGLDEAAAGLADARGAAWRMELATAPTGVRVLNDTYNASPPSMLAALTALGALPAAGRRIAVLGEMRELGEHAAAEHARVGAASAAAGVDLLVAVGEAAAPLADAARRAGVETVRVADAEDAASVVTASVAPGDVVLLKASRAVGLEVLARRLLEAAA